MVLRYRLVTDNDGHNYIIHEWQWDEFECWVDAMEEGDEDYRGEDFSKFDIGGSFHCYTFTNPKRDK